MCASLGGFCRFLARLRAAETKPFHNSSNIRHNHTHPPQFCQIPGFGAVHPCVPSVCPLVSTKTGGPWLSLRRHSFKTTSRNTEPPLRIRIYILSREHFTPQEQSVKSNGFSFLNTKACRDLHSFPVSHPPGLVGSCCRRRPEELARRSGVERYLQTRQRGTQEVRVSRRQTQPELVII